MFWVKFKSLLIFDCIKDKTSQMNALRGLMKSKDTRKDVTLNGTVTGNDVLLGVLVMTVNMIVLGLGRHLEIMTQRS